MKIRIKAITILLLIMILAIPNTVSAYTIHIDEDENGPTGVYVVVDSYSVTNERIIPGEPFVLTLDIKNASTSHYATKTLVSITNPSGVAPEYGRVSEFYLGDMEPDTTETIELKYNTWDSINADTLDFIVTIVTNDATHITTVRIPAGDEEPFSILSVDIPEIGKQGESLSTSLTFKVLGEETRKDVTYIVKVDGEETVNSTIGIITPGATKTSAVAFTIPEAGQHTIEVSLRYTDEAGQIHYMEAGRQTISIEKGDNQQITPGGADYNGGESSGPNYLGMGALAAVIVILFFTVVVILKKK